MPSLYVYYVTEDAGVAPCHQNRVTTMCVCKPAIRRTAEVGDVVVGLVSLALANERKQSERAGNPGIHRKGDCLWMGRVSKVVNMAWYGDHKPERRDSIYRIDPHTFKVRQRPNPYHGLGDAQNDISGHNVLFLNRVARFSRVSVPGLPLLGTSSLTQGHTRTTMTTKQSNSILDIYAGVSDKAAKMRSVHLGSYLESHNAMVTRFGYGRLFVGGYNDCGKKSPRAVRNADAARAAGSGAVNVPGAQMPEVDGHHDGAEDEVVNNDVAGDAGPGDAVHGDADDAHDADDADDGDGGQANIDGPDMDGHADDGNDDGIGFDAEDGAPGAALQADNGSGHGSGQGSGQGSGTQDGEDGAGTPEASTRPKRQNQGQAARRLIAEEGSSGVQAQGSGRGRGAQAQGSGRGRGAQAQGSGRGRGAQAQGSGRGRGAQAQGSGRGRGAQAQGSGRGRGAQAPAPARAPAPALALAQAPLAALGAAAPAPGQAVNIGMTGPEGIRTSNRATRGVAANKYADNYPMGSQKYIPPEPQPVHRRRTGN